MTWAEFLNEKNELYLEMYAVLKRGETPSSVFITPMEDRSNWKSIVDAVQFVVANREIRPNTWAIDKPMNWKQYVASIPFQRDVVIPTEIRNVL
jgi:hypothetical protein